MSNTTDLQTYEAEINAEFQRRLNEPFRDSAYAYNAFPNETVVTFFDNEKLDAYEKAGEELPDELYAHTLTVFYHPPCPDDVFAEIEAVFDETGAAFDLTDRGFDTLTDAVTQEVAARAERSRQDAAEAYAADVFDETGRYPTSTPSHLR